MRSPFFLSALLTLLAPAFLSGQEPVPLKPQFYPGKVYNYVTNTDVDMKLPAQPGQAAPAGRRVSMEHHARLEVGQRSQGEAGVSIQASTDRLKMHVASGGKKVELYNSDTDLAATTGEARKLARHFDGATKRTMALDLDPNGKIVKSTEGGGGGSATPLPNVPQFGPDELRQLVAGIVQGFPPDPVKPGEEWVQKGKRSLGQFGNIDFEITYRYKGDETFEGAECARIEYTGKIKGDVGELGIEGTGLNGLLVFDKLRNAVRLSEQTVRMTVEAPASGTPSGKVRLPITQIIVSKLVSVQDA